MMPLDAKRFTEADVDAFLDSADSIQIEDWIHSHCGVKECTYNGNGEWVVDGNEHDYRDVRSLLLRHEGCIDGPTACKQKLKG